MTRPTGLTLTEARERVLGVLRTLREHLDGRWPLCEAFGDLDDHPDVDDDPEVNHAVAYVTGLCEALGLDPVALCREVEPSPSNLSS
jgi:hypothetical protein